MAQKAAAAVAQKAAAQKPSAAAARKAEAAAAASWVRQEGAQIGSSGIVTGRPRNVKVTVMVTQEPLHEITVCVTFMSRRRTDTVAGGTGIVMGILLLTPGMVIFTLSVKNDLAVLAMLRTAPAPILTLPPDPVATVTV